MNRKELLEALDQKFGRLNQDLDLHLEGLLYSPVFNYWDYIKTDTLLSLQEQRTVLPDEMIFIMYHQMNELLFKMILWEMDQLAKEEQITASFFTKHLSRISRYFDILANSFQVMEDGMEPEQYLKFRTALAPGSGFQSEQYRKIELASTSIINLIDARFREDIDRNTSYEYAFEHLYWQAAGKDFKTGEKSIFLKDFETKYKDNLIEFMRFHNTRNLYTKYLELPEDDKKNLDLINAMRHYDHNVNIKWVLSHYRAAGKYLGGSQEAIEATGGSDWRKYMHPKYQRRIFFPNLWTEHELKNWGKLNLDSVDKIENYGNLEEFK